MQAQENTFVVNLIDQKQLCVNEVLYIVSFDEDEVIIMTKKGKLAVEGEELKIESLSKDNATILVTGKIEVLSFPKTKPAKTSIFNKKTK